jgi:hypothetical protein
MLSGAKSLLEIPENRDVLRCFAAINMTKTDVDRTLAQLKNMLQRFETQLIVQADEPDRYSVAIPNAAQYHKGELFAMVQIRKNYVSYHLLPVYTFPALLDNVSPALCKRMQGKSCFNFTTLDAATLGELTHLTERSYERFTHHDVLH